MIDFIYAVVIPTVVVTQAIFFFSICIYIIIENDIPEFLKFKPIRLHRFLKEYMDSYVNLSGDGKNWENTILTGLKRVKSGKLQWQSSHKDYLYCWEYQVTVKRNIPNGWEMPSEYEK